MICNSSKAKPRNRQPKAICKGDLDRSPPSRAKMESLLGADARDSIRRLGGCGNIAGRLHS